MKDIEIKISRETRKIIEISKLVIGNDGENLQGNLVFSFSDEFVRGQARLEYVLEDIENVKNKKYLPLMQVNETYGIPIKNVLTKEGKLFMQLVITEGTNEEEIPVFKSNVFFVKIKESINAEIEQPDEYPTWIEIANTKLNQIDNLDISAVKVDNVATITLTKKDGTKETIEILDGEQGPQGIQGPQGVQGPKPVKGVDYYTDEEKTEFVENITTDANSKFNQNLNEKTKTFNDNANSKLEEFNENVISKTNSFNENVTTKTEEFNTNATNKTTTFNDNATSKLNEFNDNSTTKLNEFNDNANSKVQEYNENVDNLLDNVDLICPKNDVSGEYVSIDDALGYKVFETKVDGNSYQSPTTNNLFTNNLSQNSFTGTGVVVESNTNSFQFKKGYTYKITAKFDYTDVVTSSSGNILGMRAYKADGTYTGIGSIITSVNLSSKEATIEYSFTDDYIRFIFINYANFSSGTITINSLKIVAYGPAPDYPQEIEVIDGYNLLPNEAISQTIEGVDFTVNRDRSITIKGTSSNKINYSILGNSSATSEVLKLKGGTTYSNYTGMVLTYRLTDGGYGSILNGASITPSQDMSIGFVYLSISSGTTIDTVVYPMLIKGTEIKSYVPYGCINNKVVGKNLFNKDNYIIKNGLTGFIINLPKGTYLLTSNVPLRQVKGAQTAHDNWTDAYFGYHNINANKYKITVAENVYSYLWISYNDDTGNKLGEVTYENVSQFNIQIEKGEIQTEYESYKENTYNINLQGNFIGKIGDIKDELVIDKKGNVSLIKRIGKYIVTGNEEFNTYTYNNYKIYRFPFSEIKTYSQRNLICNYFVFELEDITKTNQITNRYNNYYNVEFSTEEFITTEEFKAFLQGKYNNGIPVEFYYKLAEPETIELGTLDTPIETFDGINSIFAVTNLDTNINVKYALDIKKYTDKKVEELTNALISTSANV